MSNFCKYFSFQLQQEFDRKQREWGDGSFLTTQLQIH